MIVIESDTVPVVDANASMAGKVDADAVSAGGVDVNVVLTGVVGIDVSLAGAVDNDAVTAELCWSMKVLYKQRKYFESILRPD